MPRSFLVSVFALLALAGCKDREITAYRAPKDPVPELPGATAPNLVAPAASGDTNASGDTSMANTAVPTGADNLTWTAPAGWTAMPQRPMRKASFAIKADSGADADLSITSFPGSTGGLLANVNRWREQLGLRGLTEAALEAELLHLDSGPFHFDVVDFVGSANGTPTRTIGAVLAHGSDTWFFKFMGPDALVAREKPAFLEFLKTVKAR